MWGHIGSYPNSIKSSSTVSVYTLGLYASSLSESALRLKKSVKPFILSRVQPQKWPIICFCTIYQLRMVSTFRNGWGPGGENNQNKIYFVTCKNDVKCTFQRPCLKHSQPAPTPGSRAELLGQTLDVMVSSLHPATGGTTTPVTGTIT